MFNVLCYNTYRGKFFCADVIPHVLKLDYIMRITVNYDVAV
jgi:hypothetical protein